MGLDRPDAAAASVDAAPAHADDADLTSLLVAEISDYAILRLDPDGRIVTWNAGAQRIKGYAAEEIIGQHFSVFYPPEDVTAGKPAAELVTAAAAGRLEDEGWRLRADGTPFWAHVVITAIRDEAGVLRGFGKVTRDLTEQRRAELALRQTQELVAGVLRASTEYAIIAIDPDGLINLWNSGAERMLGYSAAEMIGHHTPEMLHDAAEVAELADELGVEPGMEVFLGPARAGVNESREFTFITKDGTRVPAMLAVSAVFGDDGEPTGYIGIARDITTEKRALEDAVTGEQRLMTLLDHLPDTTVLVIDADLRYRLAKGAGLRAHNMTDVEGRTLYDTARTAMVDDLEHLYRSGVAGEQVAAELVSAETGRTLDIDVVPLPLHGGQREALIVARDVSVARDRERRIASAVERFRLLFSEAPNGIAVIDPDGTIAEVNNAFAVLTGMSETSLVGRPLRMLDAHGNRPLLHRLLKDLADSPTGRTTGEGVVMHSGSHTLDVAVDLVQLPEQAGSQQILLNMVDISARRRYEETLAHLADHDPLTGLANRRRLDHELGSHLARCARYRPTGALLVLDLDHFKQINDTLGHGAGDQLIATIATLLQNRLRATDVVARLGGDEFAILLSEADATAATTVAADLVRRIREHSVVLDGGHTRNVTTSIGVVMIERGDLTPSELLSAADLTMYDAKEAGRDRFVLLDSVANDRTQTGSRIDWAERIRQALAHDRLVLHAQPIMDLATGSINGAELLLRLLDDDDQLIMPGRFLYIAERLGLATMLDTWVCERAVRILEDLHRIDPSFHLEVNLSGHSVGNPDLLDRLTTLITGADIDPTRLVFEITETAAVANIETARAFADKVKTLGCRFALDDFGSGFGSFYYLKHLPFDLIKIDGEFVTHCASNPTDRTILASIVGIARGLGQTTIAEFVSDATILEVVRDLGVDQAQGFHVGYPQPVAELMATLASRTTALH